MIFGRETGNNFLGYVVEVFPGKELDPTNPDDPTTFGLGDIVDSVLVGNSQQSFLQKNTQKMTNKSDVSENLDPQETGADATHVLQSSGVTDIQFNRTKNSATSKCNIIMVGTLPASVYVGNWVLVSAVTNVNSRKSAMIKFIGQIIDMTPEYTKQVNGVLTVSTQVHCYEWSHNLDTPFVWNQLGRKALVAENQSGFLANAAITAFEIGEITKKNKAYKELEVASLLSLSPFGMAEIMLGLAGMLNDSEVISSGADEFNKAVNSDVSRFSSAPAVIPEKLIKRLSVNSDNPIDIAGGFAASPLGGGQKPLTSFSSGFVTNVIGIQTEPVLNDGSWDGVFKSGGVKKLKDIYKKGFIEFEGLRPITVSCAGMLGMSWSPWKLLSNHIDSQFYEIFTDMWYEKVEVPQEDKTTISVIVAKPVVVFRDKPYLSNFLLKKTSEGTKEYQKLKSGVFENIQDGWTRYDNLPRVRIPSESIIRVAFQSTASKSYNFFRTQINAHGVFKQSELLKKTASSFFQLRPQALRFGGNEMVVVSNFFGLPRFGDKGKNITADFFDSWSSQLTALASLWHGYRYKQPDAMITLKNDDIAISLGFNVIFDIGGVDFVGQVESINLQASVNPGNGLFTNQTSLSLTRVMKVGKVEDSAPIDFDSLIANVDFDVVGEPDLEPFEINETGRLNA